MKKTIAAVLSLVLCLGLLAGCGKKNEEPAPDEAPAESTEPAAPEDTDEPAAPEGIELGTITAGDTADFEVSMEGQQVPVTMTKQTLGMGADNISIDIYVDTELYKVEYYEGAYYIAPVEEGEGMPGTYVRLEYISGQSADILAEQALTGDSEAERTDGGMVKLGSYDAYQVDFTGPDYAYYASSYYITGDSGTVCVSVMLGEDNLEGHGPRFETMLNTMVINKAA